MNETILVTGGCGFVGSNLALRLKSAYPGNKVIAFDNLHRRGSELNVRRLLDAGVAFIHGDIRNKEDFEAIGEISVLIEAAAEPSVLSGLNSSPDYVLNTNLQGAVNCLMFAKEQNAKFIFLSTSRVYPIGNLTRINFIEQATRFEISDTQTQTGVSRSGIAEEFSLEGARSFYGTSKLAAEHLTEEFAEFYNLRTIINRCGVITGPWQMGKVDQGVVVLWLAKHFWKSNLSYIGFGGAGKQVRDILHIDDLYTLIDQQLNNFELFQNKIFNAGGGRKVSISLQELTVLCEEITGNKTRIDRVTANRPGDIPIYITDYNRLTALSGWKPVHDVKRILSDAFSWMRENESELKRFLN